MAPHSRNSASLLKYIAAEVSAPVGYWGGKDIPGRKEMNILFAAVVGGAFLRLPLILRIRDGRAREPQSKGEQTGRGYSHP